MTASGLLIGRFGVVSGHSAGALNFKRTHYPEYLRLGGGQGLRGG
jgi:hypothetical protein